MEKNIKVLVKFYGHLAKGGGELLEELEVPPGTKVKEVVDRFSRKHCASITGSSGTSDQKDIEQTHIVMLNGLSMEKDKEFTSTVRDGDRITIFFPICGG